MDDAVENAQLRQRLAEVTAALELANAELARHRIEYRGVVYIPEIAAGSNDIVRVIMDDYVTRPLAKLEAAGFEHIQARSVTDWTDIRTPERTPA